MRILSVHVPKAGGLTFQDHLKRLWGKRVFWDYNRCEHPDYDGTEPIKPYILKELRKRKKSTIIHGHFFLAKYNHIPAVHRIIWLRNPVNRLLSHYYYWLRGPDMDHPLCKALHEDGLSVIEFARLPQVQNYFSRFLGGVAIDDLAFIGLVEKYDDSLNLFYNMFAVGINPKALESHKNRNFAKGDGDYQISDKVRQEIEKINSIDMELYEAGCARYEWLQERYGRGY